jgi:GntR family transcriptional regulator
MAPTGRRARTETVLAQIRAAIVSGPYRDADMLPGERDLATRFSVSRTTLRRMLAELVAEGVLRHRQGVGTFIARTAASGAAHAVAPMPQTRLAGLADTLREQGLVLASREIDRAAVLPTPDEAMMLACSPGERILRLTRVRSIGSLPLVLERAAIPWRFIADALPIGGSLYAALALCGFPPVRALQRVQAVAMSEDDAVLLGVATGTVGVSIRRTAYLTDGRCCDFTRSCYPADRYDAMTEVHLPTPTPGGAGKSPPAA